MGTSHFFLDQQQQQQLRAPYDKSTGTVMTAKDVAGVSAAFTNGYKIGSKKGTHVLQIQFRGESGTRGRLSNLPDIGTD